MKAPKLSKIQQQMRDAKALAVAVSQGTKTPNVLSETERKIISMGYAYEEMLGKYLHKPTLRFFSQNISKGQYSRTAQILLKAVLLADRHSVEYSVYIRAQFYWFDLWFRRAPKLYELVGGSGKFPAEKRLTEYLYYEYKGSLVREVSSVVLPSKNVVTDSVLDKVNRARVQQLCKAYQLTEAEALAQFAPVGLFDLKWLRRQPGFQLQREEGQ